MQRGKFHRDAQAGSLRSEAPGEGASVLRPLRKLHVVTGVGAVATAAFLLPFSPALGAYAAPLVFAAVALGTRLLSETTPGRLR